VINGSQGHTHPAGMARAMHSGVSHAGGDRRDSRTSSFSWLTIDEPSREGLKLLFMVQVEIARQDPVSASSSPSGW